MQIIAHRIYTRQKETMVILIVLSDQISKFIAYPERNGIAFSNLLLFIINGILYFAIVIIDCFTGECFTGMKIGPYFAKNLGVLKK